MIERSDHFTAFLMLSEYDSHKELLLQSANGDAILQPNKEHVSEVARGAGAGCAPAKSSSPINSSAYVARRGSLPVMDSPSQLTESPLAEHYSTLPIHLAASFCTPAELGYVVLCLLSEFITIPFV